MVYHAPHGRRAYIDTPVPRSGHGPGRLPAPGVGQRLPPTTCARQGRCCGLLPPLAPVEILAWLAELVSRPSGERVEQVAALVEHFLCNAAQRRPCPWARPGACAVYGQRFLVCRAYGLWPAPVYQERVEAAQVAQRAVATAWVNWRGALARRCAGLGAALLPAGVRFNFWVEMPQPGAGTAGL